MEHPWKGKVVLNASGRKQDGEEEMFSSNASHSGSAW